ncbi:unnamed protein product [Meloidogyne enterolobii]|uniref:Uncharacterized protein n=1 Tax=Meloidogyne enterolobii TaxID=390850 RepID=A0ACB0ZYT7_MELEN
MVVPLQSNEFFNITDSKKFLALSQYKGGIPQICLSKIFFYKNKNFIFIFSSLNYWGKNSFLFSSRV